MSNIWFTSDTHFNAQRTLEFSRRPFDDIKEMDSQMIENWNNVVRDNDVVYHLGDFGDYDAINELNGKVVLLTGNYERKDIITNFNDNFNNFKNHLLNKGFYNVLNHNQLPIQYSNRIILCSHEPSKLPLEYDRDTDIHLFGHIHEKQMIKRRGINVGVDCHDFTPISLDTILFYDNALKNHYNEEVFCD